MQPTDELKTNEQKIAFIANSVGEQGSTSVRLAIAMIELMDMERVFSTMSAYFIHRYFENIYKNLLNASTVTDEDFKKVQPLVEEWIRLSYPESFLAVLGDRIQKKKKEQ